MAKIIFLDIDGPMKSGRCYANEKFRKDRKGGFDPLAVALINLLCKRTGAQIVTNSTWNLRDNLREILAGQGIKKAYLHKHLKTTYPRAFGNSYDRLQAIQWWIGYWKRIKVERWCAIDDAPIKHDNVVLVDAENGISLDNYRQASDLLGNPDSFVVLI